MKQFSILLLLILCIAPINAANYIVAKDGSGDFTTVQAAVDACPDAVRSYIFIKNGTYYGQTFVGTKATPTSKLISIIGENRDSVILTYDVPCSSTVTFEQSCTFQFYTKNFYAENVTFQNTAGNTGQALALYTAGDMSIIKNCRLLGYQDTYRSKKGTRTYLLNCWVEGAVDFVYAGGTLIFDDCTINCTRAGGYISAPEDCYATVPKTSTATGVFLRLGFLYRNCTIKGPSSVAANSFYLGRPWGDYAGAIYVNCKLSNQVNTAGWATMGSSTYLTSCFAEYNSMDLNGVPVDTTKRIDWSIQLKKSDVDNFLTPAAFYAKGFTAVFDPLTLSIAPEAPTNVQFANGKITWDAVSGASAYMIYKNRKLIGFSTSNLYNINWLSGTYEVIALTSLGVMSGFSSSITGVKDVEISENLSYTLQSGVLTFKNEIEKVEIFDVNGSKLMDATHISQINLKKYSSKILVANITETTGLIRQIKLNIH